MENLEVKGVDLDHLKMKLEEEMQEYYSHKQIKEAISNAIKYCDKEFISIIAQYL